MQTDWRVTDSYRYLDHLGPKAFAWEFLRRNPEYRTAYRSISSAEDAASVAQRWGYTTDPDLPADPGRVVWTDPTRTLQTMS